MRRFIISIFVVQIYMNVHIGIVQIAESVCMVMEMSDYISRETAVKRFTFVVLDCLGMEPTILAEDVVEAIRALPAADVVSKGAYDQAVWERDLAISQLAEIGKGIEGSGAARVRMNIAALDAEISPSRLHDLVSIVREAATNAVKHGKAKNIVIVAEKNVLKILNDGEKFDAASALGPETGHFGLSGMKERAARSSFALSFVSEGRWCGVEVRL